MTIQTSVKFLKALRIYKKIDVLRLFLMTMAWVFVLASLTVMTTKRNPCPGCTVYTAAQIVGAAIYTTFFFIALVLSNVGIFILNSYYKSLKKEKIFTLPKSSDPLQEK